MSASSLIVRASLVALSGVGMSAQEQFDKTMSIPDSLLEEWFTLLTDWARTTRTVMSTSR